MAREEAERLNRLVGNLLDMTRIEAGALRATEEPCDVQEVVGAALDRLGSRLEGRPVTVDAPAVLAPMDFVLMVAGARQPARQCAQVLAAWHADRRQARVC